MARAQGQGCTTFTGVMRWAASCGVGLGLLLVGVEAWATGFRFTKGPYLQGLSPTSVTVRWEGSQPAGGLIEVKGPGGSVQGFPTTEAAAFHTLDVTGLVPATSYTYTVKSGAVTSPEGRFTTAPAGGTSMSFLVYGDNRTDDRAHQAVVKAMQGVPSDFLVHTGDMVEDGDSERDWDHFFAAEGPMLRDRCVFACVGNHEMSGKNVERYLRYFQVGGSGKPSLYFSVRWGNARFFILNAFANWAECEDRAWLEQELTRADTEEGLDHRFIVMHHGPYSSGYHGSNVDFCRPGLPAYLAQHKVTMVFAGHDHIYERGEQDGVRYILTGGGGAPLYKVSQSHPGARAIETVHHYVEVKIEGKVVKTNARRLDGSSMDDCVLDEAGWRCVSTTPPMPAIGTSAPKKRACDCVVPAGGAEDGEGAGAVGLAIALLLCLRRARGVS